MSPDEQADLQGVFGQPSSEFYQSITVTVPQGTDKTALKTTFETADPAAQVSLSAVKNNTEATQAEVDAATNALNQAVAVFDAAKVPDENPPVNPPAPQAPAFGGTLLRHGATGQSITDLQTKHNALGYDSGPVDGIFGPKIETAVKAFQANNGLVKDGIAGPLTWGKLFGAEVKASSGSAYPGLVKYRMTGANVKAVQEKLNSLGYNSGPVDGFFENLTLNAVKAFQTAKGLVVDGIVGPQTWGALF